MQEGEVPWVPLVSTGTWDLARMANYSPSSQDELLRNAGFWVLEKEGRTWARQTAWVNLSNTLCPDPDDLV